MITALSPRQQLMDYGTTNNFPCLAIPGYKLGQGKPIWELQVSHYSLEIINAFIRSVETLEAPQITGVQSLDLELQNRPSISTQCYKPYCNKAPKREDRNGRFWCLNHAPQKAWLAPGVTSFLEGSSWEQGKDARDFRYKDCKWYDYEKQDGPASQALDFALQRDYHVLGLQWYTDELIQMFEDQPVQAKKWAMGVYDAYVSQNSLRLEMLSRIVMAHRVDIDIHKEDIARCYICGESMSVLDWHGRAWCARHAPGEQQSSQEVVIVDEGVERCIWCQGIAEFYSASSGEALCESCWRNFS